MIAVKVQNEDGGWEAWLGINMQDTEKALQRVRRKISPLVPKLKIDTLGEIPLAEVENMPTFTSAKDKILKFEGKMAALQVTLQSLNPDPNMPALGFVCYLGPLRAA